jgi:hypothetical protein
MVCDQIYIQFSIMDAINHYTRENYEKPKQNRKIQDNELKRQSRVQSEKVRRDGFKTKFDELCNLFQLNRKSSQINKLNNGNEITGNNIQYT